MKIFASVVLYNPEIDQLRKTMDSVVDQVEKIVVIDNCSSNRYEIKKALAEYKDKLIVFWNKKNEGIARALNIVVKYCYKNEVDWLLTLDQDSVIPPEMISIYSKYIHIPNVGQICCCFTNDVLDTISEKKVDPLAFSDSKKVFYKVAACITSGCLMNIPVCVSVGGFDDRLFIDCVDQDYSFRLREKGFFILKTREVVMKHQLGNAKKKRVFGFEFVDFRYSPMRVYYQARNGIYMIRRFSEYRMVFIKSLLGNLATSILGLRLKSVLSFLFGLIDGIRLEKMT